ncbi:hypothetical protein tb265_28680 [Gemmatimonadetes bacterium T265]|nr:hypothetical protein tb265_28680 [Gemmatimonadetes bacterium T265]
MTTSATVRVDHGRFTAVAYPGDVSLARSLLDDAAERDTFPGLPRPRRHVVLLIAPDAAHFRAWGGPGAPEWGSALAFPATGRVLMQGHRAGSDAGDPRAVFRHELAHVALHEQLGELPPRWFDEGYAGYAAGEWGRDDVLAANVALLTRGVPALDSLDLLFEGGGAAAQDGYALAYRAVADLAAEDPERGLTGFFAAWRETGRFDAAVRAAYGLTAAQFEAAWRARTRRRYGVLAVGANVSLVTSVALLVLAPFWLERRRRDRARLAAMRAADAAEDARAYALAASDPLAPFLDLP